MRRMTVRLGPGVRWTSSWASQILLCTALLFLSVGWSTAAHAVPAFTQQTGQPCSACHVGAFGPQLKPYGRDFKLFGYFASDGKNHLPPIAFLAQVSGTHTRADQASPPADHFATNDNFAVDQVNVTYGGRLIGGAGAFAEFTYDGVHRAFTIDSLDVKRAFAPVTIGGKQLLLGLDVNNRPTVQDLWNSTPAWGFPFSSSALAPTPANSTLLDGKLSSRVLGVGLYAMWDDLLYAEFTAYDPVNNNTLSRLGVASPDGTDVYDGVIPYWRLALQHDFAGGHYVEVGGYGVTAKRFPGGDRSAGTDRFTDTAVDATYQYAASAKHFVSAHATWIREDEKLTASHVLSGTSASNHLDTVRADISYSYDNTWTPTVQVFRSFGSNDPVFFGGDIGSPNSDGYILELSYVPWGKAHSPVIWANARVTLQYVGYTKFNGVTKGASDNNTLYLTTRIAIAPFGALRQR